MKKQFLYVYGIVCKPKPLALLLKIHKQNSVTFQLCKQFPSVKLHHSNFNIWDLLTLSINCLIAALECPAVSFWEKSFSFFQSKKFYWHIASSFIVKFHVSQSKSWWLSVNVCRLPFCVADRILLKLVSKSSSSTSNFQKSPKVSWHNAIILYSTQVSHVMFLILRV